MLAAAPAEIVRRHDVADALESRQVRSATEHAQHAELDIAQLVAVGRLDAIAYFGVISHAYLRIGTLPHE